MKRAFGRYPRDYTNYRHHLRGLIGWDYFPLWFVFGFVLEYLHDRMVALMPYIVAVFHV